MIAQGRRFIGFIASLLLLTAQAHAAQLRDVGVIGLMSHDIFSWDHETKLNTENGRLDLSTIFDYDGGGRWKQGGNPKNCENSPVCTITMMLVKNYREELRSVSAEEARKNTVQIFHAMVKDSYQRLSGLPLPAEASSEPVTNIEQAALRAMHDILPGRVQLFRPFLKSLKLTDPLFAKLQLNEEEMNQELRPFDGDYDPEYKAIKIPFTDVVLNLKEIDGKFIEEFSPYKQADMLVELARVGSGEITINEVSFMHHIAELLSKGFCAKDNAWMPSDLVCL